ncbi:MAG TPA: hypothetical protein VJ972_11260 [Anaerolineales bacterium]|nr:hypothetical protein [Anaerolineales bacterium]
MPRKSTPPRFDPEYYSKVTLNDLVVYSVYYLHKQGSEITSEDIISACYVLFPNRFSMRKYPQYPDSGIVSRRWSDCKGKGYLRGSASKGFKLTAKGRRRAEKIEKSLGKPMKPVRVKKAASSPKGKVEKPAVPKKEAIHPELKAHARKYIRSIQASDAYKYFQKDMLPNEFDFRSLLLCTMESPPETLTRNLEQFKEYTKMLERKDLLTFLSYCEDKFSHMLVTKKKETKKGTRKKSSKTRKTTKTKKKK